MDLQTKTKVVFNLDRISVFYEDGTRESVAWAELDAVLIKTTDAGPFEEDVFFVLVGKDAQTGCVVPQGAAGEKELFTALQERLPGFDNEQVIQAMMSTENRDFLVWQR